MANDSVVHLLYCIKVGGGEAQLLVVGGGCTIDAIPSTNPRYQKNYGVISDPKTLFVNMVFIRIILNISDLGTVWVVLMSFIVL